MNPQTLPDDLDRFRLGIYMGDLTQPISLVRCLGPFTAMAKEDPRLELVFPFPVSAGADVGWTWLTRCDAIYYSHPANEFDISVLWLARVMDVPVWSEYVDDIFNVLPTNPHYQNVKNRRALREDVTKAIQMSDVVTTVSTYCQQAYPNAERFVVIPEACLWPAWTLPRRKVITWRGLASHAGDVETILDQLVGVAKDFPEWEWALLGEPSEEFVAQLREQGQRVRLAPYFSTPFHAMQAWGGCAPFLHLVPLADNPFNQAKSHLAWLEASAIGAAVIVPDHLPEWQQPGTIPYNASPIHHDGQETFGKVLRREMLRYDDLGGDFVPGVRQDPPRFHPNVAVARRAIYPERTLPVMNQRRWAVLRKLARQSKRQPIAESETVTHE